MKLTKDEKYMLSGGYGEGYRRALEILVKMGDYLGAETMVPVSVAYLTMGIDSPDNSLLKWLKEFADLGTTFKCPLTIAFPGSPEVMEVDKKMGAQFTYSSGGAPTNLFPLPVYGQYVVGAGTNDTTLFNSIIGARSNSEGPVGQYMAAIVGKTPKYGYHLPENRLGKTLFEIKADLKNDTDWNVLGFYISKQLGLNYWEVPVLTGIKPVAVNYENIISLCSTIASYGSANHFLIEGISPEARTREEAFGGQKPKQKFVVGNEELKSIYKFYSSTGKKPDMVSIFNFCSIHKIYKIAQIVEGKKLKPDIPLYVSMDNAVKNVADRLGLTKILEDAGVQLGGETFRGKRVNLWTNAKAAGVRVIVTDGAKNCHYVGQQEIEMVLLPTEECVKVALTGKLEVK